MNNNSQIEVYSTSGYCSREQYVDGRAPYFNKSDFRRECTNDTHEDNAKNALAAFFPMFNRDT